MIKYQCDICGKDLADSDPNRFVVRMEAFAAADRIVLNSRQGRAGDEIRKLIDQLNHADPDAVEDATYRHFRFDLCKRCHAGFLIDPLRRKS